MAATEVWRIRDSTSFRRLRKEGHRSRRGPLTVVWAPPSAAESSTPPRVAYAIGRKVGKAVVRNRLRRRLRAAFRSLSAPPGLFLVAASPTAVGLDRAQLERALGGAVADASASFGVTP